MGMSSTKTLPKLTASMMCAEYDCLSREVKELEDAGIDSFHIDIMDGEFVDNFGMGYQDMKFITGATSKEVDVHLMVSKPHNYLGMLYEIGVDAVYIHPESDSAPATTLEKIKNHGITTGIAINPGTSIPYVEELLNTADRVLILGVNPGHAGRSYLDYVDGKIERLLELKNKYNYEIWLDGAVTAERIRRWSRLGVVGFVLGTSCLFGKNKTYLECVKQIKSIL